MQNRLLYVTLSFILSFSFMSVYAHKGASAAGEATSGIIYADGALSVSVNGAPLRIVLEDVAAKTGIKVNLDDGVKGVIVSTVFAGLPLKDGLIRILEDAGLHDYLLVYKDRRKTVVSDIFVMKGEKKPAGSVMPGQGTQGKKPAQPAGSPFQDSPPTPMSPPQYPAVPPGFPPLPGVDSEGDESAQPPVMPPFPPQEGDGGAPFPPPPGLPGLPPGLP